MKKIHCFISGLLALMLLNSCEKVIDVDLPDNENNLVVEAYISTQFTNLSYVILTRSVNYFSTAGGYVPVSNALIYITEGSLNGADTTWDNSTRTQLIEFNTDTVKGFYLDPNRQLIGKPNKVYRLEITADNKYLYGTTYIPPTVPIDSITYTTKKLGPLVEATLTLNYMEPVPITNNYLLIYRNGTDSTIRTWGFQSGGYSFSDDFVNGQYLNQPLFNKFLQGDTVNVWLNSIDRSAYNFWESFEDASRNGGPFATPISVRSNITGGIGCFTGMSTSYKRVIVK